MPFNYLVYENAIDIFLCNKDLVAFVEDSDGLRTGQAVNCTTVVVINRNTEVVFGQYLFHQPVGTVALKTIVGSIEGDIMGVSPSVADTFIQFKHLIFKMTFQVIWYHTQHPLLKNDTLSKMK